MKKLVIDTDVGTDVDDLFALAYALKSHAVNAITIVHGDTIIRAKIARKLERILETEIPIKAGAQGNSRYWCGFEHLALLKGEIEEKFKNGPWPSYDSNTTLVCIGPLTNISAQIDEEKSKRFTSWEAITIHITLR